MDIKTALIQHLEKVITFVTLCEEKSFTKAAKKLGLAQSSLSSQLKTLEGAMGSDLVLRDVGNFMLTDLGERVNVLGRNILAEIEKVKSGLLQNVEAPKEMVIATKEPFAVHVWPKYLKKISLHFPELRFRFLIQPANDDLARLLIEEKTDVAVMPKPELPAHFRKFKLYHESFAWYRSPDCKTPEDQIVFSRALTGSFYRLGEIAVGKTIETGSHDSSLAFAIGGMGTAVLPKTVAEDAVREGKIVEVAGQEIPGVDIWLCVNEKTYQKSFKSVIKAILD